MKLRVLAAGAAAVLFGAFLILQMFAADPQATPRPEYVTIRWGGRDNTHIIRPGGQVEFVSAELRKVARPDRTDDRSFYMNVVMNGLTKDGYEFAGMTSDEIVMRRTAR